jgi:hypothetical protein
MPGLPRNGVRSPLRESDTLPPARVPPARAVRDLEGGSQGVTAAVPQLVGWAKPLDQDAIQTPGFGVAGAVRPVVPPLPSSRTPRLAWRQRL